jgi:hypothetical protein
MRARALVLLAIMSEMSLAGCSNEPQPYDEISALSAAVASAGIDCDRLDPGPEARLVDDSGTCVGSGVTLYLFDNAEDLEDWRKVGARLSPTLVGPNWAAVGEMQAMDRLAAELGGEVTTPDE